ncbi:hypothetical protein [Vibrio sp. PID17_43]|uniref:hypothetical protein n=1 Tax=Vibrio sp. PID17_43 TaxID=1583451 RepID=UPI000BFF941C|nr:hypothetical protein [Vibrio sp. PID17_43]PHJ42774.1 hypothetical protein AK965_05190 [Vibrio sp. PID17_43]
MLSKKIELKDTYLKSARVDSDLSKNFIQDIVYHGTAEHTLNTIFKSFKSKRRAFTVTGPYGSGKSTIALLLSALLERDKEIRELALAKVGSGTKKILTENIPLNNGWLVVKFVGDFEDPLTTVSKAVINEANRNSLPLLNTELPRTSAQLKILLQDLSKQASKSFDGILFIFDEMGKALDYLNNKKMDLQVFQELAEYVERSGSDSDSVPMILTGYMHQRFSGYAHALSKMQKDEWAKVQGRFEDIQFNVSSLETIELLSNSIHQCDELNYEEAMAGSLQELEKQGISYLDKVKMYSCYPLHPVVALLLGEVSKRQFGQNERSVFNFLLSRERFGLKDWLENQTTLNLYRAYDLFNYLETNFEHIIIGSSDGRAWAASEHALVEARKSNQRFEDGLEANIVKTISLLNIFANRIGIRADLGMIHALLGDTVNEKMIRESLESLVDKKLIVKRISGEYEIFHGSDLNLDAEEQKFIEANPEDVSWQKYLSEGLSNVFAARVYHEKGCIRWMGKKVHFGSTPESFDKPLCDQSYFSEFVILMKGDASTFSNKFPNIVFGQIDDAIGADLEYAAKRLAALHHVELIYKTLLQQPSSSSARQEVDERKHALKVTLDKQVDVLFNSASWYVNSNDKIVQPQGELIEIASWLAGDEIFDETPAIFNELVNRATPSAAAVAARNKLMRAMVYESTEAHLAIDGFPAEKGLYLSLLQNTGLHRLDAQSGIYGFVKSSVSDELAALWEQTHKLLADSENRVTVAELYQEWSKTPFGISNGLSPVLLLAFMLSNEGSLAFYDKDSTGQFMFITGPDEEFINKMIKRPQEVAIKSVQINALENNLISAIGRALDVEGEVTGKDTVLSLAKSIVRSVHLLSPFTKNTRKLSKSTLQFRDLALKASDPHQFVIEGIPQIFGNPETLEQNVADTLIELRSAHAEMLSKFDTNVRVAFGNRDLNELYKQAIEIYQFTTDPGLKTFTERLSEWATDHNSGVKISGLFSALSLTAERNWNDKAVDKALERLTTFASRFEQLSDIMQMNSYADNTDLIEKDHSEELRKLQTTIGALSRREQTVILQKHLDAIFKEND